MHANESYTGGNTFSNSQGKSLSTASCSIACAGDKSSTCGGNWALNAFKSNQVNVVVPSVSASASASAVQPSASVSAPSNSTTSLPSGWTAIGCRKDNVAGRTLNVDAYTSVQNMTVDACIAHCDALGHTMAGLEYARECYCGAAFVNGGGAVLADTACNMACTGDSATACGGADALTVFQKGASAGARRSHRARHFGRAHQHSGLF